MLACILEFSGRPAEALPHLEAILRLDPRYRFRSLAIADQSLCHLLLGNFDEAISLADKAVFPVAPKIAEIGERTSK